MKIWADALYLFMTGPERAAKALICRKNSLLPVWHAS
jgi:hypothetical protein